jgi:hypothetical protein
VYLVGEAMSRAAMAHQNPAISTQSKDLSHDEHDQSRKFADKSAAIANETLQKGKATVEQSVQSYSAMVEKMQGYNLKMIDMAEFTAPAIFFVRLCSSTLGPMPITAPGSCSSQEGSSEPTWDREMHA